MKTYTFTNIFDKRSYTVAANNNLFCLQDNTAAAGTKCKYWIKTKPDSEYVYKIQKTQIKAKGSAAGLVDFIKECYEKDFCQCSVNNIIKAILEGQVKEAAI